MNIERDTITKFFDKFLYVKNHCVEVRLFHSQIDYTSRQVVRTDKKLTVAGWFTDASQLVCELSRVNQVSVYATVNPVTLTRRPLHAKNTFKLLKQGEFATDLDISIIRYLIIDIDPIRLETQKKINSTDKELAECIAVRDAIVQEIDSDALFPGISGNGTFILVSLADYENDDTLHNDITRFVEYLALKYSNRFCKVDVQTRNPSRPLPLPGTRKFRDPVSTPDRPCRMVTIQANMDQYDDAYTAIRFTSVAEGSSRTTSF